MTPRTAGFTVVFAVLVTVTAVAAGAVVAADGHPDSGFTESVIVVETMTGDRLVVSDGDGFVLTYTHSVEKTPVVETYERQGDELVITRMEFSSYGAGLPADADVERTADGAFVFEPNDATTELYVSPGPIAGHELRFGSTSYDLHSLSDGETVRIYIDTRITLLSITFTQE